MVNASFLTIVPVKLMSTVSSKLTIREHSLVSLFRFILDPSLCERLAWCTRMCTLRSRHPSHSRAPQLPHTQSHLTSPLLPLPLSPHSICDKIQLMVVFLHTRTWFQITSLPALDWFLLMLPNPVATSKLTSWLESLNHHHHDPPPASPQPRPSSPLIALSLLCSGDRTPKQKVKLVVTQEPLLRLMLKYNGNRPKAEVSKKVKGDKKRHCLADCSCHEAP